MCLAQEAGSLGSDCTWGRTSAPEGNASLRGTGTSETEDEATFATVEVNPGQGLEGTNTATETLADAKGEASSEALSNHAPKSAGDGKGSFAADKEIEEKQWKN